MAHEAEHIAAGCVSPHEWGTTTFFGKLDDDAADAVNFWLDEADNYHYPSNTCRPNPAQLPSCRNYKQVHLCNTKCPAKTFCIIL